MMETNDDKRKFTTLVTREIISITKGKIQFCKQATVPQSV